MQVRSFLFKAYVAVIDLKEETWKTTDVQEKNVGVFSSPKPKRFVDNLVIRLRSIFPESIEAWKPSTIDLKGWIDLYEVRIISIPALDISYDVDDGRV